MPSETDHRSPALAAVAGLTGPGGRFELSDDDVLGTRLPVFTHRRRALHEVLHASAAHGDRDHIVTADRRVTFAEHAAQVASLARVLREEYGIGKGDRVAVAAANSVEWIEAFWATVSIGAVAVGFNAWWSAREMAYGVENAEPALVLADARQSAKLDGCPVPVLSLEDDVRRFVTAHPDAPLPSADVAEDDPAVILYTSGTSGRPKGAVHTHRNLLAVVEYHRLNDALLAEFGDPVASEDRVYLLALPLFHIASLHNLVAPRLATGSRIALHQGAFDVDAVLGMVERERVTNWGAVPTMAHRLLEHGGVDRYDTSSLTAFALASAPSTTEFKERLRREVPFAKDSLVDSYGLTESCTAIAAANPQDLAAAPGSLGRPVVGVRLEIRDPVGQALPEGEEGEVCVRSMFNMLGYWRDPEATEAAIDPDRWLRTGDLGQLREGRLYLRSRRSDLIIRGGENVYPAEIETVLAQHPDVVECLVLGVPHPDLGQEVAAVVVLRPGSTATEESLREHTADALAYFKVPKRWRLTTDQLPRNATGKVIRHAVRV
ncbi:MULTISPECIES: class I adenylate-forming enzyme family protein [Streptomyces]|uniref:class I adenylate-forming enzyme family protein n=1 Tax=Streptomyces TaxID=1883 RepID=UPI00048FFAF3|nr:MULTISPECIES: AMP-binding protein [Streptomyces]MYR72213.1 AMP-binding protein [Streptomyces sp. SID4925]MYY16432.1 AMP-binding protein [Streptomyces sp. SID4912]SBU99184.1 Acyl-CoA synthetase (AMP-forming)/AMP-acid ligase II [Streptomyces sp. OspMP-M45]SCD83746.1 Acyl-CoA synthetase (AMP-forming)/AMP-acid ligase II [Streptomyces sp. DpondAA-D4]SCE24343.1 Acyl-CoA synthetase (AMP-forming)/AMP-acid ligase II [Streptomyces sp. PpalLS-921]